MDYMGEPQPIADALRRAIAESGMSFNALERETGVLRQSLMKFARGEQCLRGDAYDRLAAFFALELRAKRNKPKGR
jgi:hypothetical protein